MYDISCLWPLAIAVLVSCINGCLRSQGLRTQLQESKLSLKHEKYQVNLIPVVFSFTHKQRTFLPVWFKKRREQNQNKESENSLTTTTPNASSHETVRNAQGLLSYFFQLLLFSTAHLLHAHVFYIWYMCNLDRSEVYLHHYETEMSLPSGLLYVCTSICTFIYTKPYCYEVNIFENSISQILIQRLTRVGVNFATGEIMSTTWIIHVCKIRTRACRFVRGVMECPMFICVAGYGVTGN